MEGLVILSYLVQKEGAREYILAEIKHREIKYKREEGQRHDKQEKEKHELKWNGRSIRLKNALCNDEQFENVKDIRPLTVKMQHWML